MRRIAAQNRCSRLANLIVLVTLWAVAQSACPSQNSVYAHDPQPSQSISETGANRVNQHGFPEDSVGASAYLRTPTDIDLDDVRAKFETIEVETDDYILGVMAHPHPSCFGHETVHAYIHRSGWIVVSQGRNDHRGKLIDWVQIRDWDCRVLVTKLEVAPRRSVQHILAQL